MDYSMILVSKHMSKYIFITGGVCSSLGKGVAASSIGSLLETRGLTIRMIKIDPYINVDAGTMNPIQHGEVYVTDDGAETDLDLGNYARFTNSSLSIANSITTGQIYQEVIRKEREGRYLGRCVQVIPHVTNEIKQRILKIGEEENVDVTIIEIGGTVGDIESIPYLEAARQFVHDLGKNRILYIHLTLIPSVSQGEFKTKPTQHSAKALREIGIHPDILLCRSTQKVSPEMRSKIALFTNVDEEAVFSAHDVETIYEIPLAFSKQKLDEIILEKLEIETKKSNLKQWERIVKIFKTTKNEVKVGIVGKYLDLHDSYKSIFEALTHAGFANNCRVRLVKIDAEELEPKSNIDNILKEIDGMLIPGGFGQRGIEGMIKAAQLARTKNVPCFGICLGMQIMVIEFARNVLKLNDANSTEFDSDSDNPVICLLEDQIDIKAFGGTMRLGRSESVLKKETRIHSIYGKVKIYERHRHRYEVSNKYRDMLDQNGMTICGVNPDQSLVESIEWNGHPWGIGVQFHPEFTSKPGPSHPLFKSFIKACLDYGSK
jgi:CTP synthase